MKIAILELDSEKEEFINGRKLAFSYVDVYKKVLEENGIPYVSVRYDNTEFWKKVDRITHFIARFKGNEPDLSIGHAILPILEARGVKCMPDYNSFQFCGDKLKLAAFYSANDIPSPQTTPVFGKEDLANWKSREGTYPVVGKLIEGASSANVMLIRSEQQLDRVAERLFRGKTVNGYMDPTFAERLKFNYQRQKPITSNCLLLQEFAKGNECDHRIVTIGARAFYYRRGNRKNDFRASGSGMRDFDIESGDPQLLGLAHELSKRYRYPMMVYDFLNRPRPMLVEMNYATKGQVIADCPGYFLPDGSFVKHDHRPPQWYQLADFLGRDDLKPVYLETIA